MAHTDFYDNLNVVDELERIDNLLQTVEVWSQDNLLREYWTNLGPFFRSILVFCNLYHRLSA